MTSNCCHCLALGSGIWATRSHRHQIWLIRDTKEFWNSWKRGEPLRLFGSGTSFGRSPIGRSGPESFKCFVADPPNKTLHISDFFDRLPSPFLGKSFFFSASLSEYLLRPRRALKPGNLQVDTLTKSPFSEVRFLFKDHAHTTFI